MANPIFSGYGYDFGPGTGIPVPGAPPPAPAPAASVGGDAFGGGQFIPTSILSGLGLPPGLLQSLGINQGGISVVGTDVLNAIQPFIRGPQGDAAALARQKLQSVAMTTSAGISAGATTQSASTAAAARVEAQRIATQGQLRATAAQVEGSIRGILLGEEGAAQRLQAQLIMQAQLQDRADRLEMASLASSTGLRDMLKARLFARGLGDQPAIGSAFDIGGPLQSLQVPTVGTPSLPDMSFLQGFAHGGLIKRGEAGLIGEGRNFEGLRAGTAEIAVPEKGGVRIIPIDKRSAFGDARSFGAGSRLTPSGSRFTGQSRAAPLASRPLEGVFWDPATSSFGRRDPVTPPVEQAPGAVDTPSVFDLSRIAAAPNIFEMSKIAAGIGATPPPATPPPPADDLASREAEFRAQAAAILDSISKGLGGNAVIAQQLLAQADRIAEMIRAGSIDAPPATNYGGAIPWYAPGGAGAGAPLGPIVSNPAFNLGAAPGSVGVDEMAMQAQLTSGQIELRNGIPWELTKDQWGNPKWVIATARFPDFLQSAQGGRGFMASQTAAPGRTLADVAATSAFGAGQTGPGASTPPPTGTTPGTLPPAGTTPPTDDGTVPGTGGLLENDLLADLGTIPAVQQGRLNRVFPAWSNLLPGGEEIGFGAGKFPMPPLVAGIWSQLSATDRDDMFTIWEIMGVDRATATMQLFKATPGFKFNPQTEFSFA